MDMKDNIIQYYENTRKYYGTYHNFKELSAWGGLVLYVIFAGTVNMVDLPDKHKILAMHILTLFVITISILVYRYISTQLKLKDSGGAYAATALIFLSELISGEKTEDELKKYMKIEKSNDKGIQSPHVLPKIFFEKSKEMNKEGRGFQDKIRTAIYGILILVTILVLVLKWANTLELQGEIVCPKAVQSISNGGKSMNFTEKLQIWTLVLTGLRTLATVIAAGGVVYAVKTFMFNTWLKAQAIYTDEEFRKARKVVFAHFGFNKGNPPTFDGPEKEQALIVCRKMDELAHLKWYVSKKKIIETWGHQMGKSWIILEKLVGDVRTQDRYLKKWKAFEGLAKEAITKYGLEQ